MIQRHVLACLKRGTVSQEITVLKAAELFDVSERQVYRFKSSFKLKGVKGLIHGNRMRVKELRNYGVEELKTPELLNS